MVDPIATEVRVSPSGPFEDLPTDAVLSVFGRTGNVVAQAGDYSATQVDNDSSVSGATVADALDGIDADVISIQNYLAALAASQVANDSSVAGVTVKDALNNLRGAVLALTTSNIANASGVAGATATDALNALAAAINALTTSNIANASGVTGASATAALNNLNARTPAAAPVNEYDLLQKVGATWGVDGSLAAPNTGDCWSWNGTLWAPRTIGVGAIQPLAAAAGTVALFPLNGSFANTVDAANPLTLDAGTTVWTEIVPGKRAFYFDGTTRLRVSAFVAAYALTGDFTCHQIWQLDSDPTSSTIFFGHGASGETQAANLLYSATESGGGTPPRLMNFLSEHGAGVNDSFTTAAPDSLPPIHNIFLLSVSRTAGVIRFGVNGSQFGLPSAALTTPDGGGSGRLYCGASDGTTTMTRAVCWGMRLDNVGASYADFKTVYNATLGQGFGTI